MRGEHGVKLWLGLCDHPQIMGLRCKIGHADIFHPLPHGYWRRDQFKAAQSYIGGVLAKNRNCGNLIFLRQKAV
jgi:hypothetical protein